MGQIAHLGVAVNLLRAGRAITSAKSHTQIDELCWNQDFDVSNFAFEVQMKIVQGDLWGILSRTNPANTNQYYDFDVCQDGSYTFSTIYGSQQLQDSGKQNISGHRDWTEPT